MMHCINPGMVFQSEMNESWVVGWVEGDELVALPLMRMQDFSWSGPIHEFLQQFTFINRKMPGKWIRAS